MPIEYRFPYRTALLTGAASGIGRALALGLARRRCRLVLVDQDLEGLKETERQIAGSVPVKLEALDLTSQAAIIHLRDRMSLRREGLDLLINNAGLAAYGAFEQVSADDFDRVMAVNFQAVVCMTRTFLPLLHHSSDARIVNVSSLFGLVAPPSQTAYAASKFAVRGFTESLAHELAGTNVGVSLVHPGGVATAIIKNARIPDGPGVDQKEIEQTGRTIQALLKLSPDRAAEIILRGVARRRFRILVGRDAKIAALIQRLFPDTYWRLLEGAA